MPEKLPRPAIGLVGVSKRFGTHVAVDDVTLEIGEGEFFSLLGPSGCGKTTTLRMVAGFELPDAGRIVLKGNDVTEVPANRWRERWSTVLRRCSWTNRSAPST